MSSFIAVYANYQGRTALSRIQTYAQEAQDDRWVTRLGRMIKHTSAPTNAQSRGPG